MTAPVRTAPAGHWDRAEVAILAAAVSRAPSVHNSQPWILETRDRTAAVFERFDVVLPRHDPAGRDRLISCGAALTNLRSAVRHLGWDAPWDLFPDPAHPDEVARVCPRQRRDTTAAEESRYRAVAARRSHRARFTAEPVAPVLAASVTGVLDVPGVQVHRVRGPEEIAALARVLGHAAAVYRADRAYQRELAAWTDFGAAPSGGDGLPAPGSEAGSLPWAGLVRESTAIPDEAVLARRIGEETHLVVVTADDGPADHVRAGAALQELWLAATAAGLAGSVATQPLHLPEARSGLVEDLALTGFPQALLRLGHPTLTPPPSTRRPLVELVRHRPSEEFS